MWPDRVSNPGPLTCESGALLTALRGPATPLRKHHTSSKTNRIYHRSLMQTKKSQPSGQRIMSETRFTEFPALSVDPRVWISRSASETDI